MESLLDFCKKYSDVDIKFIRDFIRIQQGDKARDPFKINLEIVTKQLKTEKRELFKTINRSYIKNIDFIVLLRISPGKTQVVADIIKKDIFLTVDIFKMLTMKSKTK